MPEKRTYKPRNIPKPLTIEEARNMARIRAVDAAPLWAMTPSGLRNKCIRGEVPEAVKVGQSWFVTPGGMDEMFKPKSKRVSRK